MNNSRKSTSEIGLISRRERRKEHTRRALLDVSLAYFARRGIYGTRIEDITEQADLGKGAFYNYFDSKDDLVAALLSEAVELLDYDYLSRVAATHSLPLRVNALAAAHERFFQDHADYLVLFHQARGTLLIDSDPINALRTVFLEYLGRLADKLVPSTDTDPQWTTAKRLDVAAAFAGGITGYRSHCAAAGLPHDPQTVTRVITGGVVAIVEEPGTSRDDVRNTPPTE